MPLQLTALQADVIEVFDDTPLELISFNDVIEGTCVMQKVEMTQERCRNFITLSNDFAPIHINQETAEKAGFEAPIVHGLFVSSHFSRLMGMYIPGGNTVIQHVDLGFQKPVYVGDEISFFVRVLKKNEALQLVELELLGLKDDQVRVKGKGRCIFVIK